MKKQCQLILGPEIDQRGEAVETEGGGLLQNLLRNSTIDLGVLQEVEHRYADLMILGKLTNTHWTFHNYVEHVANNCLEFRTCDNIS